MEAAGALPEEEDFETFEPVQLPPEVTSPVSPSMSLSSLPPSPPPQQPLPPQPMEAYAM
jgi:hypothetical protein